MVGAIDFIKKLQTICRKHKCSSCPVKDCCIVDQMQKLPESKIPELVRIVDNWKEGKDDSR